MDPDATLAMLRDLAESVGEYHDSDLGGVAHELADLFGALDQWILRGGYLPAAWERNKR
jgi:hypothetical protein